MSGKSRTKKMPVVNERAAGIDVGSRFHVVSIGSEEGQTREFGVYTSDLHELASWLVDCDIQSVALESTGSYWQILFTILQDYGLNPILVSGRSTKNVKGRKSDVQDAQWIQRLHSLGLLQGSFLPDNATESLKHYARHRQKLQDHASIYVRKVQQSLRLMNIRLDNVLRDVVGMSGTRIIEAIVSGERDAEKLADLMDYRVKAKREDVVKALTGDWRDSLIFEFKHCYGLYKTFRDKMSECDQEIEKLLKAAIQYLPKEKQVLINAFEPKKPKRINKNSPGFEVEKMAYATFGTDLSEIDGVAQSTLLILMSEIGNNFDQFKTSGAFASWLGLCPNNKVSGGKVLSKRTMRRSNQVSDALKRVANAIGNLKSGALNRFFSRLAYRKGRVYAITATARKVAVIIWNMVTKKEPFNYLTDESYQEKIRRGKIRSIKNQMRKHSITSLDLVPS